jgi:CHASE3 domain sensor protein
MLGFLDNWSIRLKVSAGFGLVLLVLLGVSLASLRGASETETSTERVVHQFQPAVFALMALENQVHKTAASLGFFLKSNTPATKEHYLADNSLLAETLAAAGSALEGLDDPRLMEDFSALQADAEAFAAYRRPSSIWLPRTSRTCPRSGWPRNG